MGDNKTDSMYDQPIAGHEYDGIQEFDNPLPMWWLWTFYATIIFAFIYYIHYELGGGPTLAVELKEELAKVEKLQAAAPHEVKSGEALMAIMNDKARVAAGKELFAAKCASCHGPQGGGIIGPNLTDKSWIHGKGKPEDILATVSNGVIEKGMPKWTDQMKPEEIESTVAFVYSLRGSNPSGGKAAEGTEVPDYY